MGEGGRRWSSVGLYRVAAGCWEEEEEVENDQYTTGGARLAADAFCPS